MKNKIKKTISVLLSAVMLLSVVSGLGFNAFAYAYDDEAVSGLFAARYSKYQVFDVQRSPAYPGGTQANPSEFTVKSFRTPYGMPTTETDDGWFYFKGVGSAAENGISYGTLWRCEDEGLDPYIVELWYNDNHGTDVKCSTGVVGGIGTEGFFYEGDSHWGYYFSNNQAYEYNTSLSVTYTPVQNGLVVVSREVLNNYEAGSMLVPEGYYNVTFTPGEGSGESFTYGAKSVTFSVPSVFTAPEGKVFDCWKNGSTTYNAGDVLNVSGDMTFVAQWVTGVTVTFDANGGTSVASQTIKPNTTVDSLKTKTKKSGYVFKGWKLNGVNFNLETPVTSNITLVAQWAEGMSVEESFEDGIPSDWSCTNSSYEWTEGIGDYSSETGTHSGNKNAKITHSEDNAVSYLIMPSMDLSKTTNATLNCWYINRSWGGDIDEFGVYYRIDGGEWIELFATGTVNSHSEWTEVYLELPEEMMVSNVEIGFKATDHYGYGVGLDDVVIEGALESSSEPAPTGPNNATNITVADTISENFYIDGDYYGADAYVTVNYNHNSNLSKTANFNTDDPQKLSEMDKISGGDYDGNSIISVIQAPAQVTEDITINVYASQEDALAETNAVDTIVYNVYDYCHAILEGDYASNLKELAETTLDYAAAAQLYFNYNTDDMATKDNDSNAFYNDVASADLSGVDGITTKPACVTAATMVVKSDLEINLLSLTPITASGGSIETTTGGSRFAVTNTTNGDYYVIHIAGIEPANMDNTITITTDQGDIVLTANSIMKIMANNSNANVATLAKAMYLYGVAANNYFGS